MKTRLALIAACAALFVPCLSRAIALSDAFDAPLNPALWSCSGGSVSDSELILSGLLEPIAPSGTNYVFETRFTGTLSVATRSDGILGATDCLGIVASLTDALRVSAIYADHTVLLGTSTYTAAPRDVFGIVDDGLGMAFWINGIHQFNVTTDYWAGPQLAIYGDASLEYVTIEARENGPAFDPETGGAFVPEGGATLGYLVAGVFALCGLRHIPYGQRRGAVVR